MVSCAACPNAIAQIRGGAEMPRITGQVEFYQERGSVLVCARLFGFPADKSEFYALHIHRGESCCGTDFSETGGHYNPKEEPHPYHAGDLPSLLSCHGEAFLAVRTGRFRVCDIIGKTVVIHSDADDFRSQPSGNAGKKIACGVIRGR